MAREPLARRRRPRGALLDEPGHRARRQRRLVRHRAGRDARDRRRVGLRQERHVACAARHPAARRSCDGGERAVRGCRADGDERRAAARDPRQADRDDLPGPDDEPEPGADDRAPDSRAARDASRHEQEGSRGARRRAARPGRDPEREGTAEGLSAPVLRRHASAGDDRDGAHVRAEAPDRRRADDRARRDDPGADPRPAARRSSPSATPR